MNTTVWFPQAASGKSKKMLFVFPGTAYHAKRRGVFNPSENKTLANSEGAVKYRLSDGQNYPKELSDRRIISDEVSDRRIK